MTTDIATTSSATIDLLDERTFLQVEKIARMYAASELVPQHMQGKPANVAVAYAMAAALQENPLVVMQNIYIVHGRAGWSSQYMIARANASGLIDRIRWEVQNRGTPELSVTAYAHLRDGGDRVDATVSLATAHAEGWSKTKPGLKSKYETMPELMLQYRSATQLVRLHLPQVMLGYQTVEEIRDVYAAEVIDAVEPTSVRVDPSASPQQQLLQALDVAPEPEPTPPPPPVDAPELDVGLHADDAGEEATGESRLGSREERDRLVALILDAEAIMREDGLASAIKAARGALNISYAQKISARWSVANLQAYADELEKHLPDEG